MQIFVRILNKLITLDVKSDDTILQIKQQIQDREGFSPDEQRLLFGSKQLEDDNTLADYDIRTTYSLIVVFRLRGC